MPQSPREPFLPLIRTLAQTYQAFEQFSAAHIRRMGLTPPQFDVVATLGNTPGMSCKELSEKTLITKGTLTGVLDRLEEKGLVQRAALPQDRRSVFVTLTDAGEALFAVVFPAHLRYMKTAFSHLSPQQLDTCQAELASLGEAFIRAKEQLES